MSGCMRWAWWKTLGLACGDEDDLWAKRCDLGNGFYVQCIKAARAPGGDDFFWRDERGGRQPAGAEFNVAIAVARDEVNPLSLVQM